MLVLVVGKPGSGKTTYIRLLAAKLLESNYNFQVFNDRDILLELAHDPDYSKMIRLIGSPNFEVIDNKIYDVAITRLLAKLLGFGEKGRIALVEFSRNEYTNILVQFENMFLRSNLLLIYLKTSFKICSIRNVNRNRIEASYLVPLEEMNAYFKHDDLDRLTTNYADVITIIDNNDEIHLLDEQLDSIIAKITAN